MLRSELKYLQNEVSLSIVLAYTLSQQFCLQSKNSQSIFQLILKKIWKFGIGEESLDFWVTGTELFNNSLII